MAEQDSYERVEAPEVPGELSATGISALDGVLGGGFPKGSVVLLSAGSGAGKTILSFQWLFEGVKNEENGLYITSTEPLFKTVRNLETMDFYDREAVENEHLKILDIRDLYGFGEKRFDADKVLEYIEEQVKETNAKRLCIDSVTAIAYRLGNKADVRSFIFRLGKILASLGCTTILTSEIGGVEEYSVYGVEEFISDAILKLTRQQVDGHEERVMHLVKVRGHDYKKDEIYYRINSAGIQAAATIQPTLEQPSFDERISAGTETLDDLLNGGIYRGSSTLVSGPTGSGKSILSIQFLKNGLENGENCLLASFEESKEQILRNANTFGWDLQKYIDNGQLVIRSVFPRAQYLQEHLAGIVEIVEEEGIDRCVVDSFSSLHNVFPSSAFSDFARKLNAGLKQRGVTTFYTSAVESLIGVEQLTHAQLSTTVDNIFMLRFAEMEGELHHVFNVVKMRGSTHSKGLRLFNITDDGVVIGQPLRGYSGVLTGSTTRVSETIEEKLHAAFAHHIGPMADTVFEEVKRNGLTDTVVENRIEQLTKEGVLTKEEAAAFREDVDDVLSGKALRHQVSEDSLDDYFKKGGEE